MKLLLFHLHSAMYRNLSDRFRLPRNPRRLPPFPGQQIPTAAAAGKKKVMKTADLRLTVEEMEMQGIRSVLLASPTAQLLQIIDEAAVFHPNLLHAVLCIFHSDPARRRVFVRALPPGTTAARLRGFFSKYGAVEEAEVAAAARDEVQGHVVFGNVEAVQGAIKAPGEEIAAALGGGCCSVEREECDDDDEERRRRRKEGKKKICLSGLGHVPLRRVMFVPIVYH